MFQTLVFKWEASVTRKRSWTHPFVNKLVVPTCYFYRTSSQEVLQFLNYILTYLCRSDVCILWYLYHTFVVCVGIAPHWLVNHILAYKSLTSSSVFCTFSHKSVSYSSNSLSNCFAPFKNSNLILLFAASTQQLKSLQ